MASTNTSMTERLAHTVHTLYKPDLSTRRTTQPYETVIMDDSLYKPIPKIQSLRHSHRKGSSPDTPVPELRVPVELVGLALSSCPPRTPQGSVGFAAQVSNDVHVRVGGDRVALLNSATYNFPFAIRDRYDRLKNTVSHNSHI